MADKPRNSIKSTVTSWVKILDNNIYSFRYMWHNSKGTFLISVVNALINGLMNPAVLLLNSRLYTLLGDQPFFIDALFVIFEHSRSESSSMAVESYFFQLSLAWFFPENASDCTGRPF